MKFFHLFIFICLITLTAEAQGNKRPKIVGQQALSTNEEQGITILMSDLYVEDPDDWFYPWGFTMTLYAGDNYTFQGHAVTPAPNFNGKLSVKVTVNDGMDESNVFNLEVTVSPINDKPVITGHSTLSTNEDQAITVLAEHLKVSDPDNKYPDDFTVRIHNGNNYTVNGNEITPQAGFSGTLSVNVSVHDGTVDSDVYSLPVAVNRLNRVPQITGQATLQVNEDQSLVLLLSHLTVVDDDSKYPDGFTLKIGTGANYTFSNTAITPARDFSGNLTVPVTVNDGKNTSKPFNVIVTVMPVNDVPVLTGLETEPVFYSAASASAALTANLTVLDVDGDSIMFAEVSFSPDDYQMNADKLVYASQDGKIRGIFDPNTGVLTLIGQASTASYTKALRSVQYQTLVAVAGMNKTLSFMVNDGKTNSEKVFRELVFGQASVALDIPTGFTPNGDRSNDTWKIVPLKSEESYTQARIRVYNKHGIVVYESVGFESEWDGRMNGELLPADTYYYTIDLNINAPEGYLKGLVTLLR